MKLLDAIKAQISPLFDAELGKLAGIGAAAYGVQGHTQWVAILGAAFAWAMHTIDSVYNSPKGVSPTAVPKA